MQKKQSRYIPQSVKDAVRQRDRDICRICGRNSEYMEFDHITPFSLGAPSTVENIQQLCRKCNGEKSNKTSRECFKCKGWNSHDARFCHHCGAFQEIQQVSFQPVSQTPLPNKSNAKVTIIKLVSAVTVVFGVVIGVGLILAGLAVFLGHKSNGNFGNLNVSTPSPSSPKTRSKTSQKISQSKADTPDGCEVSSTTSKVNGHEHCDTEDCDDPSTATYTVDNGDIVYPTGKAVASGFSNVGRWVEVTSTGGTMFYIAESKLACGE